MSISNKRLVTHKFLASEKPMGSFAQYNIPSHLLNKKKSICPSNFDQYILRYFIQQRGVWSME
jgi:hypothetical protein